MTAIKTRVRPKGVVTVEATVWRLALRGCEYNHMIVVARDEETARHIAAGFDDPAPSDRAWVYEHPQYTTCEPIHQEGIATEIWESKEAFDEAIARIEATEWEATK